uniref:CxC2-like cysteine cluster KDZ transposase-associated domain-containing protein n=2 Tax=Psilocybe cubensis TaxID=181762 RepID=A0A8H7XN35_PSICU
MALTTKASTYDFYRALEKSTNNTGINLPPSRYPALFRMILQWRHLQMLKWAGRGHSPTGAAGTGKGELAIQCPSCPHPSINLPVGWENAPDEMKFLYMVMICMDANFRLKNQMVSNWSQDPGLGIGWAYMIPLKGYEEYVKSRLSDKDISTCVGFQALAKANTKFSIGLRYTGLGLTVCGRSEMIMRVGNLHKGERYANMDYIFASILRTLAVQFVLASYDIACQWFINLLRRIETQWPDEIKPRSNITLMPAIPKLHEPMHKQQNHELYSYNYMPGTESAPSVYGRRTMSWQTQPRLRVRPGSRHDTLDDHFGFWNWLKYTSMGTTLLRKYKNAVAQRNIQTEGHRGLTDSLEDPRLVPAWEKMCVKWEKDPFPKTTAKNPYYVKETGASEAEVKKALHDEEAEFLSKGGTLPHKTTPSVFIGMGLDLEEAQRRLKRLATNTSADATICQEGTLTEQRNILTTRIRAWEQLVPIYMPGLLQYQTDNPPTEQSTHAEDIVLWLPSMVPAECRETICVAGLADVEQKLRMAHMTDSLNAIRQILKIKSRMIEFKNKNIRGQRGGTRSTSVIDRVHERARFAAGKYRAARKAYFELAGPGNWEQNYRVLADGDIRAYQDPARLGPRKGRRGTLDDEQVAAGMDVENQPEEGDLFLFNEERTKRQGSGQTRRTLSWIWTVCTNAADTTSEEEKDDLLRVEWARSRARVMRAKEEVSMLKEEMRRTLVFLDWKAAWWRERKNAISNASSDRLEAISAFAIVQADLQDSLAEHFQNLWRSPLQEATLRAAGSSIAATEPTSVSSTDPASTLTLLGDGDEGDDNGDDDDEYNEEEMFEESGVEELDITANSVAALV